VQTLLTVFRLCLASRATNHIITDSHPSRGPIPTVSDSLTAAAALEPRTCRDRFGSLPVARFALRSCAMCYVYLGNVTDRRRLLPVPPHYEALTRVDANHTVTQA